MYNNLMKTDYKNFIQFVCDLLTIPIPDIQFIKDKTYFNVFGKTSVHPGVKSSANATTFPKEKLIVVDLDKLKDEMSVYITLAYEIRHVYQYIALYEDEELKEELTPTDIIEWKKELNNYQDSTEETYVNQSIEIDAIAFSYVVCLYVLHIEVNSICDSKKLSERIQWLKLNYTKEEILECATYQNFTVRNIQA